jgi:penicillin-binding protein 1A
MSDATAFMISDMLLGVQSLTHYDPPNIAKKTGTTNYDDKTMKDYNMPWDATRDSWIVGYSTKTVLALWYGYDTFTVESIAQGYVLHNVPAARQKDALFNALVAAGAIEANRDGFVAPASVSRVAVAAGSNPAKLAVPGGPTVYEYFKKGTEPTEYDLSNYRIPAPANLRASENNGKVTLSWSAVSPGELGDSSHGTFGYNVYKDNVLIAWTDKTTYSFNPSNVYGVYKIIGTYKSYNDLQTDAATIEIKEIKVDPPKEPEKEPEEEPINQGEQNTP